MNNFYNSKNAKQQSVISQESGLFLHALGWTLGVICFGFPHVTCHQVALGQFGHNPTSIQLQNMLKLTPASDIKWVRMSYWSTSEPLLGAFYVKTKPSGKLPQETRGHDHPTFKKPCPVLRHHSRSANHRPLRKLKQILALWTWADFQFWLKNTG